MASIQDQLNELFSAMRQQRIVTYANVAALTWISYEIILTMPQELKVIWRGKPTLVKLFYLVGRYYSFVMLIMIMAVTTFTGDLSESFCKAWIKVYASVPIAVSYAVDTLLLIRIYALYNKSKLLLALLMIPYLGGLGTAAAMCVITLRATQYIEKPFGLPYPGCLVTVPVEIDKTAAAWSISLFTQVVFFVLVLYKFIESIKSFLAHDNPTAEKGGGTLKGGRFVVAFRRFRRLAPLFSLFVRDGTLAFLVVLAVVLFNLILAMEFNKGPIEQLGTPCLLSADAVLVSRLVLNLGTYLDGTPVISVGSGVTYDGNEITGMTAYSGAPRFADNGATTGRTVETITIDSSYTRNREGDFELGALDSRGRVT